MRRLLVVLLFLIVTAPAFATVRFLRVGASGSNNGTSWTNAYPSTTTMNSAASGFAAGDIICIAAGTYSGQGIVTGKAGSSGSPIKYQASAAADANCGSTTSGWNSAYEGQVILSGGALISHSFITIDGLTYSDTEGSSGISMPVANTSGNPSGIGVGAATSGVIIKNIDIGVTGCGPSGCNQNGDSRAIDMNHFNGSSYDTQTNWLIQYANLHGACTILWTASSNNLIIEHSRFADSIDNTPGNPNCHPNVMATQDTTAGTFRYNEVVNWQVEGIMSCPNGACTAQWDLYGNIWHDPTAGGFPRVYEAQGSAALVHSYNNTFANISFSSYGTANGGSYSAGSASLNDIFYATPTPGLPSNDYGACNTPSLCSQAHGQTITSAIFSNFAAKTVAGYQLASDTTAGNTLASPYTSDLYGTTRGANGTWDRGFFQITGSASAPTVTTTSPSATGTTTGSGGGNVTSDGGASVTSRGTCYSTSSNPTSPCTSDGTGTGAFSSSFSGLTASTLYHVRAFATNSVGTSYGSDLTFTTSSPGTSTPSSLNGGNSQGVTFH